MEEKTVDIIIIGGGAAGMMAAVGASETYRQKGKEAKVLILEKMPRPGRKIMITGKGRCNFTNVKQWNEFCSHIHPKPNFLKASFYNLSSEDMLSFFERQGVECAVERGDRAFPASHLASDIVDALAKAASEAGAEIRCNKEVKACFHEQNGNSQFHIVCSDGSKYFCSKLIICTGGLSYPKTGSSGDGYLWAEEMGHKIKQRFPSLTAIVPKGYKDDTTKETEKDLKGHIDRATPQTEIGKYLCGNQLKNVGLSLYIDGKLAQDEFGDLDFTDGGLEGPIGFKISRKCVNAIINGSKASISIDLKPAVDLDDLNVRINCLWNEIGKDKKNSNKQYKDKYRILLTKLMPSPLIPAFCKLNPNTDHKSLGRVLKDWKMEVAGFVGYERAVVTAGGINLEDITAKTLESKLIPGLYFAGEILDLDGDTGGYNLQTAFSTGYMAGINAAKD